MNLQQKLANSFALQPNWAEKTQKQLMSDFQAFMKTVSYDSQTRVIRMNHKFVDYMRYYQYNWDFIFRMKDTDIANFRRFLSTEKKYAQKTLDNLMTEWSHFYKFIVDKYEIKNWWDIYAYRRRCYARRRWSGLENWENPFGRELEGDGK